MTKPSPIFITKLHPLEQMSEQELAAVRKFLFGGMRGLNEQHEKRWRRFWRRVLQAEIGEVFHIDNVVGRSGPFHRMHMAMEQGLFDRQERWANIKHMRNWLKTGAGWGTYELVNGRMKFVPKSTSYEECSDDEMREVHEAMVAYLRSPSALRKLWPHLSADQRSEMLETILERPEETQT